MNLAHSKLSEDFTTRTWLVELRGDTKLLAELFDNFNYHVLGPDKEPHFFLVLEYGQVFLQSPTFEHLFEPRHVQKEGERLLNLMNGILKFQQPGHPNEVIDVGGIYVAEANGATRVPTLVSSPCQVTSSKSEPTESSKLRDLAASDKSVEKVLELYGSCHNVWLVLWAMFQIIAPDMAATDNEGSSLSKEKLEHFQVTAQNHAHGKYDPFPYRQSEYDENKLPMPLIEARMVMQALLERWIDWKMSHIPCEMALSIGE